MDCLDPVAFSTPVLTFVTLSSIRNVISFAGHRLEIAGQQPDLVVLVDFQAVRQIALCNRPGEIDCLGDRHADPSCNEESDGRRPDDGNTQGDEDQHMPSAEELCWASGLKSQAQSSADCRFFFMNTWYKNPSGHAFQRPAGAAYPR
jgi:hypothetical protein